MRRLVVFLLFSVCLVLVAAPAPGAVMQGPWIIIPVLDIQLEMQMNWMFDPSQKPVSDLKSRWGTEGPPKGRPATK